ncbi:ABC transporter G family member 25 [Populus alba]|uniref:ABC transporter G family member 25-like n=2 Tax=Populus TaxID=3689 RepID=A0A4U5QX94_POPAL|nr:ABC transporter G family member 25-like [Populus alba]KAJ6975595.1 ABC transporter G family member 25-like [Populus alba x Populus x berolinensis]TKS15748.1 ABC transporter G family member 25-like [Populus alba]
MPLYNGVETTRGDSSDGPDQSKAPPPRDSRDLPSLMLSSCYPITLKFMEVGYRVKFENRNKGSNIKRILGHEPTVCDQIQERTILNGITGMASPGEILAVLGPSGSGKSTFLNALAGRIQSNSFKGTILANNRKPTKQIMKRTGFVTQDDILYPHLTVRETLVFCSLLRLPKSLSKQEKTLVAESVISELGLTKCENTIIGNSFIRGISGGERKRVSIAHEMLINPSLLILDEPTSGLDATAAYRLVLTLGSLAQKGKTIVTSMHQPSSRVYQMFDSVLVLSEGRCLYFGKGSEAMSYFSTTGYSPSFPMNPADFLLDLANGVFQTDGVSGRDKPNVKQSLIASYNTLLAPKARAAFMETKENGIGSYNSKEHRSSDRISIDDWFNQFSILLQRSLKERKHESFNTLRVFQVIMAAVFAGLMWWHSDFRDVQDRLGLLFFMSIFWGVFPSSNSVFVFPQERAIFVKERASGMYTLSSYFMSRIVGDLPMELILPTIFLSVTYWMAGLKPELGAFLLTLLVLLGYVLVSQGLGLALGAAIMDAKQASTLVTITMLAFVLTGGFYVHKLPSCIAWIKYISTTFYSYKLLINVQYGEGKRLSSLLGCSLPHGSDRASCKFVEQDVAGQISPVVSVSVLIFMFVGYRLLAYLALRRIKA